MEELRLEWVREKAGKYWPLQWKILPSAHQTPLWRVNLYTMNTFPNFFSTTIMEVLSREDKEAREKLWPLVKKAREEGKKSSFRGPSASINGKQIDHPDIV
ncbi:hypothetical protein GOODEAATRI_029787 [Goodea atripinnis]|uniref:Uncharacterized protein n=1 Tax=Goodea atripinnis TaxID=208336 RepID=A0ABV0PSU9_9TELE